MIIAGEFPAPMKLGNRNRWKQSVVYKWVEELQATTKKMAERTSAIHLLTDPTMKAFIRLGKINCHIIVTFLVKL